MPILIILGFLKCVWKIPRGKKPSRRPSIAQRLPRQRRSLSGDQGRSYTTQFNSSLITTSIKVGMSPHPRDYSQLASGIRRSVDCANGWGLWSRFQCGSPTRQCISLSILECYEARGSRRLDFTHSDYASVSLTLTC